MAGTALLTTFRVDTTTSQWIGYEVSWDFAGRLDVQADVF